MEIHKPKPIHSWRELATEIGVIVVGILIALGLEQAIEAYHTRERTEVAREAIEAELRFSLAKATVIARMKNCSERQMEAISDAIGSGDQAEVRRLVAAAHLPQPYTWSDAAWTNALASDAGEHFSAEQRRAYAILYGIVAELDTKQRDYADSLGRLRAIALTGLSLTPEATGAELAEMAHLTSSLRGQWEITAVFQDASMRLFKMSASKDDVAILPNSGLAEKCEAVAGALDLSRATRR